ncbi:unnamed protein product [Callosobruchus maculatus]|uniref:Uncharacterized protein n=1 Tax=Callosobruchus maculatus TaxID=64391 RepID=A0A653C240_CALMS|nr:unnamed protein product [Callosobruchus maculatus]
MYVGRNNLLNRCLITWEHNVVRWVELILCLVCLLLAILMFYKRVFITTKIVHVAVHSAFVFILATDVISWCVKTPITIKTWMLISMTGFLMYCFTSGLLLFFTASSSTGLIIFSTVANIITAIVFLLDCLWVCWEYIHADYRTVIDADLRVIPGGTGPRIKSMTRSENLVDRAVSPYSLSEINEFECPVVRKRRGNLVYPAARPMRPMSYGGTFAVDKDLAPMSSGGSYRAISSVSGVTVPPTQQTRSRRSVRLVSVSSRTTGSSYMLNKSRDNTPCNTCSSHRVSKSECHTDTDDEPQGDQGCCCARVYGIPCDCSEAPMAVQDDSKVNGSCSACEDRESSEVIRTDIEESQNDTESTSTVRFSCAVHSYQ